jgi:protein SCO1/2
MDRFMALASMAFGLLPPVAAVAGDAALGDIPLVNQMGQPFHLRELIGRPAAVTFVATRCRDTCPIVDAVFSRVARDGVRARLVTVSLDPAYDTAAVMASFASELLARAPQWSVVTGRPDDVAHVLSAFGVIVEKGADGVQDAHGDFIYVLDEHGQLERTLPLSIRSVPDLRAALAHGAR